MAVIKTMDELLATPSDKLPMLLVEIGQSLIEAQASKGDSYSNGVAIKSGLYEKIYPKINDSKKRAAAYNALLKAPAGTQLNATSINNIALVLELDKINQQWLQNNSTSNNELDLKLTFFMTALKKMQKITGQAAIYNASTASHKDSFQVPKSRAHKKKDTILAKATISFLSELIEASAITNEEAAKIGDFIKTLTLQQEKKFSR